MSTTASGIASPAAAVVTGRSAQPTAVDKSPAPVRTQEHDRTMATPAHLAPQNCFVRGGAAHADTDHTFLFNAAALTEAREDNQRTVHRYPDGETSPEAVYVAEHRPC
ncbi:hypothetical protein [Mycolicibacterium conceptionense]|uniref:hypothetical protein n=1 Tax=Mycolicibacterium conceptionense TaxID=451644 RepID=UPI003204983D